MTNKLGRREYNFLSIHGFKFGSPFKKCEDSGLRFSKSFLVCDSCSITNTPTKAKTWPTHFKSLSIKHWGVYSHATLISNSFTFFLLNKKNEVSSVNSSTPHHMIVMSNTTYVIRTLLELSLELPTKWSNSRNPTINPHPQ